MRGAESTPAVAVAVAEPAPEPVKEQAPAPPPIPAPLTSTSTPREYLLPAFPCRMLWSPRKAWGIDTKLSVKELGELFESQLLSRPSALKRFNGYHRRVTWDVKRNAISGQVVASCRAAGPIPIGFGASKVHVDINGDTLLLDPAEKAGGRTDATVGVGRYTTWNNLYMFPATSHTYEFVKAVKAKDRSADVRYPWSIFRIVLVGLITLYILIALIASAGGGASASTEDFTTTDSAVVAGTSEPVVEEDTATPEPTVDEAVETATPEPTSTPSSALPDVSRSEMRDEIAGMLRTWHEDIVNGDSQAAWDLLTTRKQSQNDRKYGFEEWATGQATLAPYLDPSGLRVKVLDTDDQTGVVTVDVRGMHWSKPNARCSTWSGITWVRYEDGAWRYDPGYSTTPQRERAWKARFGELLGGSC